MASTDFQRSSSSSSPVALGQSQYRQAARQQAKNYRTVQQTFGRGQQALNQGLPQAYGTLDQTQSQVLKTLGLGGGGWGVATPAAQAIAQGFAQQQGATQQQMINSGLGNTTVLANLTQQNTANAAQAYGSLGSQLANYAAGFISNLGQRKSEEQIQGAGMQANLYGEEGKTLADYKFHPWAPQYGQTSQSSSSGQGQSTNPMMGGGGGGGSSGILTNEPNFGSSPFSYDISGPTSKGETPSWLMGGSGLAAGGGGGGDYQIPGYAEPHEQAPGVSGGGGGYTESFFGD